MGIIDRFFSFSLISFLVSFFHLVSTFIGILLTFSPMHFLGFNVMQRRIPDFPDSFHSWNFLSSIGSGITFLSFAIFFFVVSYYLFLDPNYGFIIKDLFLGSQWSIILGYRRLSVKFLHFRLLVLSSYYYL